MLDICGILDMCVHKIMDLAVSRVEMQLDLMPSRV